MSELVKLVSPHDIEPNPENPRLIFREKELLSLRESIAQQGILVPLTVYSKNSRKGYVILDGERRWRCAMKLGMRNVPVIVQPKPGKLQNIMMMFAIHNARKDWDPLPTALKLETLQAGLEKLHGKRPTESVLAASASLTIGEVRRLRRILALPEEAKNQLLDELEKPRSKQVLTVDHFLETYKGVQQLEKRELLTPNNASLLIKEIIIKFSEKVEKSTVAPRLLPKIARAFERDEIDRKTVNACLKRLYEDREYTIAAAYQDIAVSPEENHKLELAAKQMGQKLRKFDREIGELSETARNELIELKDLIEQLLD